MEALSNKYEDLYLLLKKMYALNPRIPDESREFEINWTLRRFNEKKSSYDRRAILELAKKQSEIMQLDDLETLRTFARLRKYFLNLNITFRSFTTVVTI